MHVTGFFFFSALYREHSISPLACLHSSETLIKNCFHLYIAHMTIKKKNWTTFDEIPSRHLTCIFLVPLHWPQLCGSRPVNPSLWLLDCAGHYAASAKPHPPAHFYVAQQQVKRPPPLPHLQLIKNIVVIWIVETCSYKKIQNIVSRILQYNLIIWML